MSTPIRIAFLCHAYHRGGVTRWMADAALALSERGHEVYFIAPEPISEFYSGKGRETLLQLLGKVPNNIKIIKAPVGPEFEFGTPEYKIYIYKELITQLPAFTPIVLSDDASVWASAAAMSEAYPIVGVLHADEEPYYQLGTKYHKQVSVFACVSHRVHDTFIKRMPGIDTTRIPVIPCGINLPPINIIKSTDSIIKVVYVGRVSEFQKRVSDLVKVSTCLKEKGADFQLNVVGDGDARHGLEMQVKEKGLQGHVAFLGWLSQKEVAGHLASSDILLLTSDFEGTPVAMMEALSSGCGIVGTRVSGIEDYEHSPGAENCYAVFNVGDISDAADKIQKIALVPKDIRRHAARQIAEAEFSMDICLDRYLTAIAAIKDEKKAVVFRISLPLKARIKSRVISFARNFKVKMKRS